MCTGAVGTPPPVFLYNNMQNEKEDIQQCAAAVHGAVRAHSLEYIDIMMYKRTSADKAAKTA